MRHPPKVLGIWLCVLFATQTITKAIDGNWQPLDGPTGENTFIADMRVHQGSLYIVGRFTSIAGVNAQNMARWDGTNCP